jgi:hypothetical protein
MENKFINGIVTKKPSEKTPWIKAKLSFNIQQLISALKAFDGEWINLNVCESKDGSKYYTVIDDWKPTVGKVVEAGETDSLDF